jgi:hypothetical protein
MKMKTVEFIKQFGVDALTEQLGIKVRREGGLLVLNYDQIESPRTDPITIECRSLILKEGTLQVVSRSFDRFFNLGEALNVMPTIDWNRAVMFDKVDGSLIKIYHYANKWHVATRGTAFADVPVGNWDITFQELVFKALGVENDAEFQKLCQMSILCPTVTYIFEVTSVENRVVKHYSGYKLHFLGARESFGDYNYVCEREKLWFQTDSCGFAKRIQFPKAYHFNSAEACEQAARELKDLDEGYIVYQGGVPIAKVKSPAYVAVHHIRGEGLNPKRASELVLSGEVDEYLTYFPEDEVVLEPYMSAMGELMVDIYQASKATHNIEDQKEFALAIAQHHFKGVLFTARKLGIEWNEAFNKQRLSARVDQLSKYIK